MFCKALKMTFGSLTLVCAWGAAGEGDSKADETTKQLQRSRQNKCTICRANKKSFWNCCAKGTCRSQVTEARASFLRAQWWAMSWSRHQDLPVNQPLGGAACLSRRSPSSSSLLPSPGSEHSTQRLSPAQHSKWHSHLPCLAAAPFIQHTTQGRYSNPPLWNQGLICAPCSISSQNEIEVQCGKTSFVLHLAQETEGPLLDLSAMHLLSDYTLGLSAWNLQW